MSSKVTGVLLMLFAVSVLISQSLMDLFSTLLCLYLAYGWVQARRQQRVFAPVQRMGFDWLWVAWFAVAAMGFILNRPPPAETPDNFWLARLVEYKWILILYFMVGAFRLSNFKLDTMKWFFGASLACSVYALVDYVWQIQNTPEFEGRLGGIYQFSMTHAHVYGVVFCCLLGLLFHTFSGLRIRYKAFYAVTTLLVGATVLLTFTRGIWIAAFLAVIAMAFLWRLRNGLIALILCPAVALTLYYTVPAVRERVDFTAKVTHAKDAKESYDTERLVLWKTNLMIFKDHPVFGAGYGQNKFLLHEYYEKQGLPKDQFIGHAHNQYLHLLAGTGILGLLCYLGVLGLIALLTLRAYLLIPKTDGFHKGLALGALGGQICFAFGGLTESNFEHSKVRFGIMFMWALGLWLWSKFRGHRSPSGF